MLKNGVGRGMSQIRTTNLLAQTIPDKIFRTKWRYTVKLDRKGKVWYLFCVFLLLLQKAIFLKGGWELGYVSTQN